MTSSTPRVLLIYTDQQRWDSLPCYGLEFMRTPHLDRIAREGIVFDHAFTPSPVCQPARASLMTGLNPLTHRVLANQCWYPPETPVWVRDVGAAGHHTAAIGKMHFHPWNDWGGFRDRIIAEDKTDYHRRDQYALWLEAHGHRREFPGAQPGYSEGLGAYTSALPPELHIDRFIGDRGAEWLRAHARESFFAWISFCSPHSPYDPPSDLAGLYRDAPIPPPVGYPAELDTKPSAQRSSQQGYSGRRALAVGLDRATEAQFRWIREHYQATVTLVDQQIGKLLAALEEAGVLDETLVIFTSDHGDALGDHGLMAKTFFYESMVRVPLLMRGPGIPAGARSPALVDVLDLVPTILEHMDVRFDVPVQGRKLEPLFTDPGAAHHDAVFSAVGSRAMVRTHQWKLVRYGTGEGELYDLEADPAELHNLYRAPDHRDVQGELEARLLTHTVASVGASTRFVRTPPDLERRLYDLEGAERERSFG